MNDCVYCVPTNLKGDEFYYLKKCSALWKMGEHFYMKYCKKKKERKQMTLNSLNYALT